MTLGHVRDTNVGLRKEGSMFGLLLCFIPLHQMVKLEAVGATTNLQTQLKNHLSA